MDEAFAYFLENLGPAVARRDVEPAYAERFRGWLPERLRSYWVEHGWCGYAEGLFWTVDPADYEEVLGTFLKTTRFDGSDEYQVIARTAFGALYVWGAKSGASLKIDAPLGLLFPNPKAADYVAGDRSDTAVQTFFAAKERRMLDFFDESGDPLFVRALKKLGPLRPDEMYGFEPALAFGGRASLDHVKRVKAREHLVLLAQIGAPRIMESPLLT